MRPQSTYENTKKDSCTTRAFFGFTSVCGRFLLRVCLRHIQSQPRSVRRLLRQSEQERPRYRQQTQGPWIPPETMIDQIIAHAGKKLGIFIETAKETGAASGELARLRWIDIDVEHNKVAINLPTKRHNPRRISVSSKPIGRLNSRQKNSEKVFGELTAKIAIIKLCRLRNKVAYKLGDERLRKINFARHLHRSSSWL